MGIATYGIPKEIVLELARLNGSTVFVETGTFHGETTRWAAKHFEAVHTIERAQDLYDLHSKELARLGRVTPHLGDSREVLPRIVGEMGGRKAVYWLDGHWSGGQTAGENDECPLLGELECLSSRAEDLVLIDDARYFLCAPPRAYNPSEWPTIPDIINALPKSVRDPFVQILDDVIFVVPDTDALRGCLVGYAQMRWEKLGKLQQGRGWLRLKGLIRKMVRR